MKIADCIIETDRFGVSRVWEPTDLSTDQHAKITFFEGQPYGEIESRNFRSNLPVGLERSIAHIEWKENCLEQKQALIEIASES